MMGNAQAGQEQLKKLLMELVRRVAELEKRVRKLEVKDPPVAP